MFPLQRFWHQSDYFLQHKYRISTMLTVSKYNVTHKQKRYTKQDLGPADRDHHEASDGGVDV